MNLSVTSSKCLVLCAMQHEGRCIEANSLQETKVMSRHWQMTLSRFLPLSGFISACCCSWAHIICAVAIPECSFGKSQLREPIHIDSISADRWTLVHICCIYVIWFRVFCLKSTEQLEQTLSYLFPCVFTEMSILCATWWTKLWSLCSVFISSLLCIVPCDMCSQNRTTYFFGRISSNSEVLLLQTQLYDTGKMDRQTDRLYRPLKFI